MSKEQGSGDEIKNFIDVTVRAGEAPEPMVLVVVVGNPGDISLLVGGADQYIAREVSVASLPNEAANSSSRSNWLVSGLSGSLIRLQFEVSSRAGSPAVSTSFRVAQGEIDVEDAFAQAVGFSTFPSSWSE